MEENKIIIENDQFIFKMVNPQLESKKIFNFLNFVYGRNFSIAEYQWYKINHPYLKDRIYIAQEEFTASYAAIMCMLPFQYRLGKNIYEISLAHSAATHKDFQRKGLFVALNKIISKHELILGTKYGLGFPNSSALKGHIKAGWENSLKLMTFEKRNLIKRNSEVKEINRFDIRFDKFYFEATECFDFVHLKDSNILNWRYIERPDIRYKVYAVEEKDNLKGFIVMKRHNQGGLLKSHIVDFLAIDEQSAELLICAAENYAYGSDLLNLWMPHKCKYEKIFRDCGFVPTDDRSPLILRSNDKNINIPSFVSPWIVFGDNDVY